MPSSLFAAREALSSFSFLLSSRGLSPLSNLLSSCFAPRSHWVFCSSVKGIRKMECGRETGKEGWLQGRGAAGRMERFGCVFKEAEDQTVLLYFLREVNSHTHSGKREACYYGSLQPCIRHWFAFHKRECMVKSISVWKQENLQQLTTSSWYNVIFHFNAYLSSRWQRGTGCFQIVPFDWLTLFKQQSFRLIHVTLISSSQIYSLLLAFLCLPWILAMTLPDC